MLFHQRNFDLNIFSGRNVFEAPNSHPEHNEAAQNTESPPLTPEKTEEQRKARELIKSETAEKRKEIIDESGNAMEYAKTFEQFTKTPGFDHLTKYLQEGMSWNAPNTLFNYENWVTWERTEDVACFIELGAAAGTFPVGKGRQAFLDGLKCGVPKETDSEEIKQKYRESRDALQEIVKKLKSHFEKVGISKADTEAQAEKPLLGDTISNKVNTLLKNYNRASGKEKAAILASVGIAIVLLYQLKDKKLPSFLKNKTYKDAFLFMGAAFGINYLSGKVSKDGRTLLQKMDIFRDVDQLRDDNVLKAFANQYGMGENQEKLRSLFALQRSNVKELFLLYREARQDSNISGKKEISQERLVQMGFKRNQVDSAGAYQIMEALVQDTAKNEAQSFIQSQEQEAKKSGALYPSEEKQKVLKRFQDNAIAVFEGKYIEGEFKDVSVTLFDAIIFETRAKPISEINLQARERRLTNRALKGGKEAAKWTYEKSKPYAQAAGRKTVQIGKKVYEVGRDSVVIPIVGHARRLNAKYVAPHTVQPVREWLGERQKEDLNKVLPPEFNVEVTKASAAGTSEATIMGLPRIPFEIKVTTDGKEVAIINDIEFLLDDGVQKNKSNADRLAQSLERKMQSLLRTNSENRPQLLGKTPQWEKGRWVFKDVEVEGDKNFGMAQKEKISVRLAIANDGSIHFYTAGKEISDFDKLDGAYRDSVIEGKVRNLLKEKLGRDRKFLGDLPVYVENVEERTPKEGPLIKGNIAGLKFFAILKSNPAAPGNLGVHQGGLQFCDANGKGAGGAEKLKIRQNNGGPQFLEALSNRILLKDSYSVEPFISLENQIENTGEGFLARLGEMAKTKRLWIIPTNVKGGVNGQILHNQWKKTLEFKMKETLDFFKHDLQDNSLEYLDIKYKANIVTTHNELTSLSQTIQTMTEEQRADNFENLLARVEIANYPCKQYQDLFQSYKTAVEKYNYKGLDSTDLPLSGEYYDVYQTLLRVWSANTRQYANGDPADGATLTPKAERWINYVISQVQDRLDEAQKKGSISFANLPKAQTEDDLRAWIH